MIKSTPILRRMLELPEIQALPVFSQIPDQLLSCATTSQLTSVAAMTSSARPLTHPAPESQR